MLRVVDGCLGVETAATHPDARRLFQDVDPILIIEVSRPSERFYKGFGIKIVVLSQPIGKVISSSGNVRLHDFHSSKMSGHCLFSFEYQYG